MAGKGDSRSASKSRAKTVARQALARKKAKLYFQKLGLRKLAKRLEARVSDVRSWLEHKRPFPSDKLSLAAALGKPGGLRTTVRGAKLSKLVENIGQRRATVITGLSARTIKETLQRRPGATLSIERDRLAQLVKKEGLTKTTEILGATRLSITRANTRPVTKATERLRAFVKEQGPEKAARYIGVSPRQLSGWLKKNIPFVWESLVNWKLGRPTKNTPTGPSQTAIDRAAPVTQKEIDSALKRVAAWNRKVEHRQRINLKEAERWARTRTFEERFSAAEKALAASRKPQKPARPQPRPTPPKRPTIIPPAAMPPTKKGKPPPRKPPAKPPKKPPLPPPPPIEEIPERKKREFLQARYEAFSDGRYPAPITKWGRIALWKLTNRQGVHAYWRVEKFVHEIDLDKLKRQMVDNTIRVWMSLKGKDPQMTVRCMFSAMGNGNPFYPDAFQEGDDVNFFSNNIYIRPSDEPDKTLRQHVDDRIAEKLQQIYELDVEEVMLFFEYYEAIKSIIP